jgi:Cu-Zn family superoxide dismutase
MMRLLAPTLAFALPLIASAAPERPAAPVARAELKDASGNAVGTATFSPVDQGVAVQIVVKKLPPGSHGFHVHEAGKCDAPEFKSAGGHFNPAGKQHGLQNPRGHHAGDMPNLSVGQDGTGTGVFVIDGATLGDGTSSLFHEGGTALVIHAGADDMKTDPAGSSGARIACGVIEHAR